MAEAANDQAADGAAREPRRGGAAWFIGVFVVVVLLLLTGYRYAIATPTNDWYLFQVAKHTAWFLGLIGDDAELEGQLRSTEDARRMRAELAAWQRGESSPDAAAIAAAPNDPLSPWERYQHRVAGTRAQGASSAPGPRVRFVWRESVAAKIGRIESLIAAAPETDGRRAMLKTQLEELRLLQRDMQKDPDLLRAHQELPFNFIVIPECGAIEVMSIFFAAVVAFPAAWWKRLVGLLLGVPIMYLVNIFRLSCLAVIGAIDQGGDWFDFAHEYVWQAVYIVFVVMVWLAWVEYVVRLRRSDDDEEAEDNGQA
jgi:exosortase/archaeosortase family protein